MELGNYGSDGCLVYEVPSKRTGICCNRATLTIDLDISIATIKLMDSWATKGFSRETSMWRIMHEFVGRRECR